MCLALPMAIASDDRFRRAHRAGGQARRQLRRTGGFHAKRIAASRPKRLLPQPGGFEGLTFVIELSNTHDHPVPDGE